MTITSPRQIQASASPDIIRNAASFFDNDDYSILRELLQNSRRAGATEVLITTDGPVWSYEDNGRGCEPEELMLFGGTFWGQDVKDSECPAGLGFFALARRNPLVSSRDWMVRLTEANFRGEPADVDPATIREGFAVSFDKRETASYEDGRLAAGDIFTWAALTTHCGMDVQVNGCKMPRADTFEAANTIDTVVIDTVPGVSLVVGIKPYSYNGSYSWSALIADRSRQALLGGVVLDFGNCGLPLDQIHLSALDITVRLSADSEALLPLELPQRNKLIKTPLLEEIKLKILHAGLRLYASQVDRAGGRVGYGQWEAFLRGGYDGPVALPVYVAEVRPFGEERWESVRVSGLDALGHLLWSHGNFVTEPFSLILPFDMLRATTENMRLFQPDVRATYPLLAARFPQIFDTLDAARQQLEGAQVFEVRLTTGNVTRVYKIGEEDRDAETSYDAETFSELLSEAGKDGVVVDRITVSTTWDDGYREEHDIPYLWDMEDLEDIDRNFVVTAKWLEDTRDPEWVLYELLSKAEDPDSEEGEAVRAMVIKNTCRRLSAMAGRTREWAVNQIEERLASIDLSDMDTILDHEEVVVRFRRVSAYRVAHTVSFEPRKPA